MSMVQRKKIVKILVLVLLVVFYASLLTNKIRLPAADDLPRQIMIGQQIVQGNWHILYENTFSYTEPHFTFYNHHWLSGVIFYLLDTALGWPGLSIFKIVILLTTFGILFKASLKKADFWLVALVSLPAILILQERTGLRPEVFSYLFIAIYIYTLLHAAEHPESNQIWWLIPLQLLWVNMHVFFSIGLMLVAGFLLEKIIIHWHTLKKNVLVKKAAVVLVAIIIVSFMNPRGVGGVFYRYPSISLPISENQSIAEYEKYAAANADISVRIFKPVVAAAAVSLIIFGIFRHRQKQPKALPIFYFLAILATIILSFMVMRGLALFGYMLLLFLPAILNEPWLYLRERMARTNPKIRVIVGKVLIVCLVITLAWCTYLRGSGTIGGYAERGLGLASMSEGGIHFFQANNLTGPIFNDSDIGSYLIYYLYPQEKVFSDNRFGDAYSSSFWDDTYLPTLGSEIKWQEEFQKYNFNVIFLYQYDGGPNFREFMYNRMRDPAWVFVYGDAFSIIFVRNVPANQTVIDTYRITSANAYERLDYLLASPIEDDQVAAADIFNLLGRVDLSRKVFLDVVTKRPNNGKIWMIMAEWELTENNPANSLLALTFLEKAIDVGQTTAEAYSFLGLAYFRLEQLEKSKEMLEKALKMNPEREDAKSLLLELDKG